MSLTKDLAESVFAIGSSELGTAASNIAKRCFIDTVGVALAGRNERAVQILEQTLPHESGGASGLLSQSKAATAADTALINATAAHVLDFDDVALRGHPSAVIVPSTLALGAELDCTGDRALRSYVAGYQVWAEIIRREKQLYHVKGWHPSGVLGAVASSAACAVMLELPPDKIRNAISIGAGNSSGLVANFGSMAKPYQIGCAARAGVMAAKLAQKGFTGSESSLESDRGLLSALSPEGNYDITSEILSTNDGFALEYEPPSIKKYPTCFYTHRALDGIYEAREKINFGLEEIRSIEVLISEEHYRILQYPFPENSMEARFSLEFCVACYLAVGRLGLSEIDNYVYDPQVRRLMEKVIPVFTNSYDPIVPGLSLYSEVCITTNTGVQVNSKPLRYPEGHPRKPIASEALKTKFKDCLQYSGALISPAGIYDRLMKMEQEKISRLVREVSNEINQL